MLKLFIPIATLMIGVPALCATPPTDRATAIKETRAAIDGEVQQHGGTWEAWAASLQPYRDDLRHIMATQKWPWPAKRNFVFQGKEAELAFLDVLDKQAPGQRPLDAMINLDRQLKARGIDLIVMPIPDKLAIYPDYLTEKVPADRLTTIAAKRLIADLCAQDIEAIDLYTLFRDYRKAHEDGPDLHYDKDSHWRNQAAQLAGEAIAARLQRYDFVQQAQAAGIPYTTKPFRRADGVKADDILGVFDAKSGAAYRDAGNSPILLTGDSFSMYNMNNGGGLTAQVARHIGLPLSIMCKEGLNAAMPVELANAEKQKGYLRGRRVVIWTFGSRFLASGPWLSAEIPLPAGFEPIIRDVAATGTVAQRSAPPAPQPEYPNYVMKFYLTGLKDAAGKPIGDGTGVVHILALREGKRLPIADVMPGQPLALTLTTWTVMEAQYGQTMTGTLEDVALEGDSRHYWGQVQP